MDDVRASARSVVVFDRFMRPVIVRWRNRSADPDGLIVVLHGRGADEASLDALTNRLPGRFSVVAVRGFVREGRGHSWFTYQDVGRPEPRSVRQCVRRMRSWLDMTWTGPTYLLGFSAGAAAAGALLLEDPRRFAGAALLAGALPLDSGVNTGAGRLRGVPVFRGRGAADRVVPLELVARTSDFLTRSRADLTDRCYRGLGHDIDGAMVRDVVTWFASR